MEEWGAIDHTRGRGNLGKRRCFPALTFTDTLQQYHCLHTGCPSGKLAGLNVPYLHITIIMTGVLGVRLGVRNFAIFVFLIYLGALLLFQSRLSFSNEGSSPGGADTNNNNPRNKPGLEGVDNMDQSLKNSGKLNGGSTLKTTVKRLIGSREMAGCSKLNTSGEFLKIDDQVFVYSAYYDTRSDHNIPIDRVRMMAVLHQRKTNQGPAIPMPDLFCHFRTQSGNVFVMNVDRYEMCENHKKKWGGFILTCLVPEQVPSPPCEVFVTTSETPSRTTTNGTTIQIRHPPSPQRTKHKFGVCISPLFASIDPKMMIEFIEMSKILGADHFTFYDFRMSPEVSQVLDYYKDIVTIIPWRLPYYLDKYVWYHGQIIAINDCLYHNVGRSEHLVINDIDEFIIPYLHSNWTLMADHIEKNLLKTKEKLAGFCFQSIFLEDPRKVYFEEKYPPPRTPLRTMEHTIRSKRISKVRTKCMVRPELVYELGIHHISRPFMPYVGAGVWPSMGLLYHYRPCLANYGMKCGEYMVDDTLAVNYGKELIQRYRTVEQAIELTRVTSSPETSSSKPQSWLIWFFNALLPWR